MSNEGYIHISGSSGVKGEAVIIREAISADDYRAFGDLIREYVDWCRKRYAHDQWFIEAAFSHQSLDAELQTLSLTYGPPNGSILLAVEDGDVKGACAYRRLSQEVCEMKRLFVPSRNQGKGIGRLLCQNIIVKAREEGFNLIRLDTGKLLTEAIAMYKSAGFQECSAYNEYPSELMPNIIFMELPLAVRD
jgi:GNAT superfamily N-acetyltransferase